MRSMHRAVVSGITGHLGVEVARQLVAAGVEVFGLTRQHAALDHPVVASANLRRIDGCTETLLGIFAELRPDTVFHLAGLSRRTHRSEDIVPFVEANILLGTQILEAMRLSGCGRIVTAGTYLQHFDSDEYRAFNLYAATKQAFEGLLAYYVEEYGLTAVRLTLCDIYSEHDKRPKLMTDIVNSWASGIPLRLREARARIDLIHVADAAAAFLQAARLIESADIPSQTLTRYSVSSGRDLTATELVELFERVSGKTLNVVQGNAAPVRNLTPWRGAGMPGWMPRISLEDGIVRICKAGEA
jgi:nucleoside-diphosphate-sugar epimerase